MENKINIAELLKDCPKGMELDCTICNNVVTLEGVDTVGYHPIRVMSKDGFHHVLTHEGCIYKREDAKCVIFPKGKTTWEGFVPPCEFKDGDIVATPNGLWIGITTGGKSSESTPTYCVTTDTGGFEAYFNYREKWKFQRLATEEEKKKLFDAIKENGYKWNAETKKIEKLTSNKFDITTLVPFESRVLVRDSIDGIEEYDGECSAVWRPAVFGIYAKDIDDAYPFGVVGGCYFRYCIPYEGNEHLLGKTEDCDDFYKNW